jgi:secreted trypsin-like serine protease
MQYSMGGYKENFVVREIVTVWFIWISEGAPKPIISPKIAGGQAVLPGQFPHQAALVIGSAFECSGSLIARDWILTTAHCLPA